MHQASDTLTLSPDPLEPLAAGMELNGHLPKMSIPATRGSRGSDESVKVADA